MSQFPQTLSFGGDEYYLVYDKDSQLPMPFPDMRAMRPRNFDVQELKVPNVQNNVWSLMIDMEGQLPNGQIAQYRATRLYEKDPRHEMHLTASGAKVKNPTMTDTEVSHYLMQFFVQNMPIYARIARTPVGNIASGWWDTIFNAQRAAAQINQVTPQVATERMQPVDMQAVMQPQKAEEEAKVAQQTPQQPTQQMQKPPQPLQTIQQPEKKE